MSARVSRSLLLRFIAPLAALAAVVAGSVLTLGDERAATVAMLAMTLAAIVLVGLLFHRWWIAPLRRIADAAEAMTIDDWHLRAELLGTMEIRHLADRLNEAADQTRRQLNDLRHQRGDLQALVDALPDPIVVTDPGGRVRVINEPAARLLRVLPQQVLGAKLITAVSDGQLLELFEQAGKLDAESEPAAADLRITRDGRRNVYQAMGSRTRQGGVLLLLRDVSTLAGAMQMKTDFVANASHELRTPIAAIKAGFETLGDVWLDDRDAAAKCMSIIGGHVHRLEEMLRDLLDLSRVESAHLRPELSQVSAGELCGAIESVWGPIAREKDVRFDIDLPMPQLRFVSDRRLLDLIAKNLVENSIKFTPAGGTVTLHLSRQDDGVCVRVTDSGIGIPREHLERVFERFYQVDAARSGSAGRGTGLGLAIVKHAAHALGGTIDLQSQPGRGTTATIVLPIREQEANVL